MTCHILEEFPKKPFNILNQILPQDSLKEYWIPLDPTESTTSFLP
jgi:hypothetical protein